MYVSSPRSKLTLDLEKTIQFTRTIDWDKITSCGFYGGEPSINIELYQKFVDLIPSSVPKFIITNGRWSLDYKKEKGECSKFLNWCNDNRLWIKVSGTPEHKKYQNRHFLEIFYENMKRDGYNVMGLKEDDELHPMGRLAKEEWTCTRKCLTHPQPTRCAIFPTGDIIMQNCDGVYPVIGNYRQHFTQIFYNARNYRLTGCREDHTTWNINDVLCEKGLINGL
jgi:hypothetical protein